MEYPRTRRKNEDSALSGLFLFSILLLGPLSSSLSEASHFPNAPSERGSSRTPLIYMPPPPRKKGNVTSTQEVIHICRYSASPLCQVYFELYNELREEEGEALPSDPHRSPLEDLGTKSSSAKKKNSSEAAAADDRKSSERVYSVVELSKSGQKKAVELRTMGEKSPDDGRVKTQRSQDSTLSEVRVLPPEGFFGGNTGALRRRSNSGNLHQGIFVAHKGSSDLRTKLEKVLEEEGRTRKQLMKQFAPTMFSNLIGDSDGSSGRRRRTKEKGKVAANKPTSSPNRRQLISTSPYMGVAGADFPTYDSIPDTAFRCRGLRAGYYADPETKCQVYHYCHSDGRQDSFLCPKGTVFNQAVLVCDWWYNAQCNHWGRRSKEPLLDQGHIYKNAPYSSAYTPLAHSSGDDGVDLANFLPATKTSPPPQVLFSTRLSHPVPQFKDPRSLVTPPSPAAAALGTGPSMVQTAFGSDVEDRLRKIRELLKLNRDKISLAVNTNLRSKPTSEVKVNEVDEYYYYEDDYGDNIEDYYYDDGHDGGGQNGVIDFYALDKKGDDYSFDYYDEEELMLMQEQRGKKSSETTPAITFEEPVRAPSPPFPPPGESDPGVAQNEATEDPEDEEKSSSHKIEDNNKSAGFDSLLSLAKHKGEEAEGKLPSSLAHLVGFTMKKLEEEEDREEEEKATFKNRRMGQQQEVVGDSSVLVVHPETVDVILAPLKAVVEPGVSRLLLEAGSNKDNDNRDNNNNSNVDEGTLRQLTQLLKDTSEMIRQQSAMDASVDIEDRLIMVMAQQILMDEIRKQQQQSLESSAFSPLGMSGILQHPVSSGLSLQPPEALKASAVSAGILSAHSSDFFASDSENRRILQENLLATKARLDEPQRPQEQQHWQPQPIPPSLVLQYQQGLKVEQQSRHQHHHQEQQQQHEPSSGGSGLSPPLPASQGRPLSFTTSASMSVEDGATHTFGFSSALDEKFGQRDGGDRWASGNSIPIHQGADPFARRKTTTTTTTTKQNKKPTSSAIWRTLKSMPFLGRLVGG